MWRRLVDFMAGLINQILAKLGERAETLRRLK